VVRAEILKARDKFSLKRAEFCTGCCENSICAHEAEESPLLEAVARERLVKKRLEKA
jgi:hypothetical protein